MVIRYSPRKQRPSQGAKAKSSSPAKVQLSTPKKSAKGSKAAPRASKSSASNSPSTPVHRGRRVSTSSAGGSEATGKRTSKGGRKKKQQSEENAGQHERKSASVDFASELSHLGRSETFGRPNSILRQALEILLRLSESGSSAGVERHELERMIMAQMGGISKSSASQAIRHAVEKNLLKAKPVEHEIISLSRSVTQKLMREVEQKQRAEAEETEAEGRQHQSGEEKENTENEMEEEA